MITADLVKTFDDTKSQLLECATQKALEEVFERAKITDTETKIALLNSCMQVQDSYGIPGDNKVTTEEFYRETLAFFEDGQWRKLI